jgi:type IV pilus assembly protein PilN
MYGLDINFLKDRAETIASPTQKKKAAPLPASAMLPLFIGIAVGLIVPGLVGGFWLWVNLETSKTQEELNAKSAELATLQQETQQVQNLQQEIEVARSQSDALVNVFKEIRSWSAVLQDVRDRVPEGVTISGLTQAETEQAAAEGEAATVAPPPTVEISGFAQSYSQINDFILTLKASEFFNPEQTFILSSQLADYPISNKPANIELPQVVEYQIVSQLNEIPDDQLLSILERKGAFGLAERLRTAERFQQTGGGTSQ